MTLERRFVSYAVAVIFSALGTGLLAGCGESSGESSPVNLGIENIARAVAAVREQQRAEPRFFEINSTAEGVNLFIAVTRSGDLGVPDAVIQGRFTTESGLVLSDELLDASGSVFSVTNLELSADRLVRNVVAELRTSTPLMFVLTATNGADSDALPVMRILMESARGGRLAVFVDRDGVILGTEVLEE